MTTRIEFQLTESDVADAVSMWVTEAIDAGRPLPPVLLGGRDTLLVDVVFTKVDLRAAVRNWLVEHGRLDQAAADALADDAITVGPGTVVTATTFADTDAE